MVELALITGIFSYLVFGIGLLGGLGRLGILGILGGLGIICLIFFKKKKLKSWFAEIFQEAKKDKIFLLLIILFLLQTLVNFIGAIGPELGFDALWYHLTIPKIFLQQNRIFFIPGSLYYYSVMPKLVEMLYLFSLTVSKTGILAKIIHFSFGILSAIALYNLSRKYLKERESILAVLIFYSTLIVGWQSISAYVDLGRTFFEFLALDLFLQWTAHKKTVDLIESAVLLGLAVSTKLIALATLPVFLILILWQSRKILNVFSFLLVTLLIPFPWFVFSYLHTGNPIYPVFSGILDSSHRLLLPNILDYFKDLFLIFYHPSDMISPVFLIFLPIVLFFIFKRGLKNSKEGTNLFFYVILSLFFWVLTPRTGGSRFLLPYLPAISLLIVWVISLQCEFLKKSLLIVAVLSSVINLGYRSLTNFKFLPVVLGKTTAESFLLKRLNFNNSDFYDQNGEIQKLILKDDLVLVLGGHNLFYLNFPFHHESFAKKGVYYHYLLTQRTELPQKYQNLRAIYQNPVTGTSLYLFGRIWNE